MDKELVYNIILATYMKKYNIPDEIFVFPPNFISCDIETKIGILVEAFNNNIKVDETDKYLQHIEGYYVEHSNDEIEEDLIKN